MVSGKEALVVDTVVEHELQYVTPDMEDWFGANLDKGYPLWHPESHKSLMWEVSPSQAGGMVDAVLIAEEYIGLVRPGGPPKVRMVFVDPIDVIDLTVIYDHVKVNGVRDPDGKVRNWLAHQYEATSYGLRMRSIFHREKGFPRQASEAWAEHNKEEMGWQQYFLPELYKLWQEVKDPMINPQVCLKVKKLPDGRWTYVNPKRAGEKRTYWSPK
jgi:hypothetical protein